MILNIFGWLFEQRSMGVGKMREKKCVKLERKAAMQLCNAAPVGVACPLGLQTLALIATHAIGTHVWALPTFLKTLILNSFLPKIYFR